MVKKSIDPFLIFVQARQFMLADEHLRRPVGDHLVTKFSTPSIVSSAFAVELFLKCLRAMESTTVPTGHDLSMLFKGLSNDARKSIEVRWDVFAASMSKRFDMMENFSGNTIPRDLPSALHKCKDAFTLMRYVYEDPKAPVFYVGDLSRILHDVAVAQRPEWAESSGMTKLLELPAIPVE